MKLVNGGRNKWQKSTVYFRWFSCMSIINFIIPILHLYWFSSEGGVCHMQARLSIMWGIRRPSLIDFLLTVFWQMIFVSHHTMSIIKHDLWRWCVDTLDGWHVGLNICTSEYYRRLVPRDPTWLLLPLCSVEMMMGYLWSTMSMWY